MGNIVKAKEILELSIKNRIAIDIHYQKLCELIKDEPEKVYDLFREGILQFPKSKILREEFAEFLDEYNKHDEALLHHEALFKIEPDNPKYMTLLGNSYMNNGLNNKALEIYKRANTRAEGKEGWIIANIGNIYKNQGFYSEAMSYLKKAIEIEPDSDYNHDRLVTSIKLKNEEEEKLKEILSNAHMKNTFN